jgi:hypothetical protein
MLLSLGTQRVRVSQSKTEVSARAVLTGQRGVQRSFVFFETHRWYLYET